MVWFWTKNPCCNYWIVAQDDSIWLIVLQFGNENLMTLTRKIIKINSKHKNQVWVECKFFFSFKRLRRRKTCTTTPRDWRKSCHWKVDLLEASESWRWPNAFFSTFILQCLAHNGKHNVWKDRKKAFEVNAQKIGQKWFYNVVAEKLRKPNKHKIFLEDVVEGLMWNTCAFNVCINSRRKDVPKSRKIVHPCS